MSWQDRVRRIGNSLRMLWKRILSYRKREWTFSDYPIVVREQKDVPAGDRYWARILGWLVDETAATRHEALRKLEVLYAIRKDKLIQEGKPLPRPGTAVPIQFASQARVDAHQELQQDFIRRILELPWAFISDESSLWDFHNGENNDTFRRRIREIYDVDVSDIVSGNLADILERIAQTRAMGDI